jgi:preprotein translocase subunit SecD
MHPARADPLQRAERDQPAHAGREAAQRGADQEQAGADVERRLAPQHVGQTAVNRDGDRLEQQVAGEHPAEHAEAAEIGDDAGHRGRDDGAFDRRHERRDQAGRQHQRPPHRRTKLRLRLRNG